MNLGGADVIYAKNWNFGLKLCLDNHFKEKFGSRDMGVHFLPKNEPKQPVDQDINNLYRSLKF